MRGQWGLPTGLGGGLTSDLGEGVLSKAGIEDGIRDLVTVGELVRKGDSLELQCLFRGKRTQSYRGDPLRRTRR